MKPIYGVHLGKTRHSLLRRGTPVRRREAPPLGLTVAGASPRAPRTARDRHRAPPHAAADRPRRQLRHATAPTVPQATTLPSSGTVQLPDHRIYTVAAPGQTPELDDIALKIHVVRWRRSVPGAVATPGTAIFAIIQVSITNRSSKAQKVGPTQIWLIDQAIPALPGLAVGQGRTAGHRPADPGRAGPSRGTWRTGCRGGFPGACSCTGSPMPTPSRTRSRSVWPATLPPNERPRLSHRAPG